MPYNIVCHGNSLTLGATQTPYPDQLETLLGAGHTVHNEGYGGQGTQFLYDNFLTHVQPHYDYDATMTNVVIFWEATNQLGAAEWEASDDYALQQDYVTLAHSYNWKVIVCNIIQRGNAIDLPQWRLRLVDFNALIAGSDRVFADGYLDIWSLEADFQSEFTGVGPVASYIDEAHLNTSRYGFIAADALLELPVVDGVQVGTDIAGTRTRIYSAYENKSFSLDGTNYYSDANGVATSIPSLGLTAYAGVG